VAANGLLLVLALDCPAVVADFLSLSLSVVIVVSSFLLSVVVDDVVVVPFVVAATLVPVTEAAAAGVFDWNAVRLIL